MSDTLMSRTIVEDKRKAAAPQPDVQHGLMTVGIAPVLFSDESFRRCGHVKRDRRPGLRMIAEGR